MTLSDSKAVLKIALIGIVAVSAGIVWHSVAVGVLAFGLAFLHVVLEAERG